MTRTQLKALKVGDKVIHDGTVGTIIFNHVRTNTVRIDWGSNAAGTRTYHFALPGMKPFLSEIKVAPRLKSKHSPEVSRLTVRLMLKDSKISLLEEGNRKLRTQNQRFRNAIQRLRDNRAQWNFLMREFGELGELSVV